MRFGWPAACCCLLIVVGCSSSATPTPTVPANAVSISVGTAHFIAEVASDPSSQAQGLSGRPSLPADRAMWFVYGSEFMPTFWMKGMQFPLDIVWVGGNLNVVDVTADIPAPAPETPADSLPLYSPRVRAQYVLEINAGQAKQFGIVPGAKVTVGTP